jgi:hypothetical protein
VPIVHGADGAAVTQEQRVLDLIRSVRRIGIPHPLDAPQRAAVVVGLHEQRVVAERLADVVGREERRAAGPRVHEGRPGRRREVRSGRHVPDRVVDEHRIEDPPQAHRPHVARHVLALGVDLPAEREHRLGAVGERAPEALFEIQRVVSGTRAEFE